MACLLLRLSLVAFGLKLILGLIAEYVLEHAVFEFLIINFELKLTLRKIAFLFFIAFVFLFFSFSLDLKISKIVLLFLFLLSIEQAVGFLFFVGSLRFILFLE